LHETAQLGLGISWVPDGGIAPSPGREPLVRILDDEIGRDVPLHMGIPSALVDVPKVRIFLQSFDEMRAFVFGQLAPPGPPKTVP
jgi:DNA-binding transcriptional LysR family regulator